MAYYKTCPECGANLDPGEICDCGGELHDFGVKRLKNDMVLSINGKVFEGFREAFDKMLHGIISEMEKRNSRDGKLTAETAVTITKVRELDPSTGRESISRKVPSFEFRIGSAIVERSKMDFRQDYYESELLLNEDGEYVIRDRKDQLSIFDDEGSEQA